MGIIAFVIAVEGVSKRSSRKGQSQEAQSSQPNTDLGPTLTNVDETEAAILLNKQKQDRAKEEQKRRKEREKEERERRRERRSFLINANKIHKRARLLEKNRRYRRRRKAEEEAVEIAQRQQGKSGEGSSGPAPTGLMGNPVSIAVRTTGLMGNPVSIAVPTTGLMRPPSLPFSSRPPSYPVFSSWLSSSPSPDPSNFNDDAENPPQPRNPAPPFSSLPVSSIWFSSSSSLSSSTWFSFSSSSAPSNLYGDGRNPPQPTRVSGEPTGNSFRNFGGVTFKMKDVPPKKRNSAPATGLMRNPADSIPAAATGSMRNTPVFNPSTATRSMRPPPDSHRDPFFSSPSFSSSAAPFNFDSRYLPEPTGAPEEAAGHQNLGRDKYKMEDVPPKKRNFAPKNE